MTPFPISDLIAIISRWVNKISSNIWVVLCILGISIFIYMSIKRITPFLLSNLESEFLTYLSRSWQLIILFAFIALILRALKLKKTLAIEIIFSTISTIILTPVPFGLSGLPGFLGVIPNGLVPYYFSPFDLTVFMGWYGTQLAALATFIISLSLSRLIIGRYSVNKKPV